MRISKTTSVALFTLVLSAAASFAQSLPMAKRPEDVGVSSQRLERFRKILKSDVDSNKVPGSVLLVARHGKIATLDATGFQERKSQKPMAKDSIFRIASMTKPIVTVAAMILADEGRLDIGAPVAQYLPEFRDVKVGPEKVAPQRPMTLQDLMRHTSGLTYVIFGTSPVDQLYRKANIFGAKSLEEMVKTIASLPLLHQPGEVWEYSVSSDVLGRVVEVVGGMPLDQFIAERITGPLKMPDTAFYLNASQAARLARADAPLPLLDGDPTVKPAVFSGGGGLLSTAGERPTPVALSLGAFGPTPEMGTSFGLGFAIRTDAGRNPVAGSVGDFSWGGIAGTIFWIDPKESLVAVMMIQAPRGVLVPNGRQTRTMVYSALLN